MFNVGDKVRILSNESGGEFPLGTIAKIVDITPSDPILTYRLSDGSDTWWYGPDDIEKVEEFPVYDQREDAWVESVISLTASPLTIEKKFSHERYQEIVNQTIEQINELSEKKGGEYAGDVDRLANFRRNAQNLELTMEDIWSVYAGKHWDAIQQYVKDVRSGKKRERLESISGRADDMIVYLILFKAMVEERGN